jgi:hypothetical protein
MKAVTHHGFSSAVPQANFKKKKQRWNGVLTKSAATSFVPFHSPRH